jgi:hypothetical protein
VLIMLAALTPLGTFAVMQARLDVWVQHHINRATTAFAVAEAGVEHACAELRLDPGFDRLLAGPDRQPETLDDGEFPYHQARALTLDPEFQYDLRVVARDASTVDLFSTATGPERSTHTLALTVVRDRAFLPAAVTATAATTTLDLGADFRLTGHDRAGRDPAQPGLAVASSEMATSLRQDLPAESAQRIDGDGGLPSIAAGVAFSAEELAGKFAIERTHDVGPQVNGAIGSGIAVSAGSLDIDTAAGDGVLIVEGNLRVTGDLSFSGIVIVLGDVLFESGSTVGIQGGLLQGRSNGVLALLGTGAIAYDSAVIERIDTAYPGRLSHRAHIVGWRDPS